MSKLRKAPVSVRPLDILNYLVSEKIFFTIVAIGILLAAFMTGMGQVAMWLGFAFAAYSTVANDSIQSLGTFIESNNHRKWWVLWLFIGAIFVMTVTFSFFYFDGDVTYQRLLNDAGETKYPHPSQFGFFQLIAPIVLLVLTHFRMPVSTTFLMLSVFSADASGITSIVFKSVSGYLLAFLFSYLIWYFGYDLIRRYFKQRQAHPAWTFAQWTVSGLLWAVWVMQDGANVAVFLPRKLDTFQFLVFTGTIFFGLGILLYLRGDKIQRIVSEKTRISDVRAATLIDFSYVLLLIYKLFISTIPMSTTWVFLGVIGGRELAINLARLKSGDAHKFKAIKFIRRDFTFAVVGLLISVILAIGANPRIRQEIGAYFASFFG